MRLAQVFDYSTFADGEQADVDADAAAAAAEQEAKLREAKARDRYVDSLNRIRATGAGARGSVANASGLAAVAPKHKVRCIPFVARSGTSQVRQSPRLTRSARRPRVRAQEREATLQKTFKTIQELARFSEQQQEEDEKTDSESETDDD